MRLFGRSKRQRLVYVGVVSFIAFTTASFAMVPPEFLAKVLAAVSGGHVSLFSVIWAYIWGETKRPSRHAMYEGDPKDV